VTLSCGSGRRCSAWVAAFGLLGSTAARKAAAHVGSMFSWRSSGIAGLARPRLPRANLNEPYLTDRGLSRGRRFSASGVLSIRRPRAEPGVSAARTGPRDTRTPTLSPRGRPSSSFISTPPPRWRAAALTVATAAVLLVPRRAKPAVPSYVIFLGDQTRNARPFRGRLGLLLHRRRIRPSCWTGQILRGTQTETVRYGRQRPPPAGTNAGPAKPAGLLSWWPVDLHFSCPLGHRRTGHHGSLLVAASSRGSTTACPFSASIIFSASRDQTPLRH